MALSDQQRRFAEYVVQGANATDAYRRAGYKARGNAAEVTACQLLRNPKVAEYVAELRQKAEQDAGVTAKMIIEGLHAEAQYRDEGASHSARVTAWATLAKIRGLFDTAEKPTERTVRVIRETIDRGRRNTDPD